jgi:hypothetical protein
MWTSHRRLLIVAVVALSTAGAARPARGQERTAPDRVELGAFPGGGILFRSGASSSEPGFGNYTFGVSCTWNVSSKFGIEAEAGFGFGGQKTVAFAGRTLTSQAMPDTISYSGDLVVSPRGRRRAVVPYALVGLGAFNVMKREGTEALGVTQSQALLAGNIGAGVKWFAVRGWGLRADYRVFLIQRNDAASEFFGGLGTRYGHRLYAAAFATF